MHFCRVIILFLQPFKDPVTQKILRQLQLLQYEVSSRNGTTYVIGVPTLLILHTLHCTKMPTYTLQVDVTLAVKELKAILPDICKYLEATEPAFQSYSTLYLLSCPEDSSVGLTFHHVKNSGQVLSSHLMPCEVEKVHKDMFLKVCLF